MKVRTLAAFAGLAVPGPLRGHTERAARVESFMTEAETLGVPRGRALAIWADETGRAPFEDVMARARDALVSAAGTPSLAPLVGRLARTTRYSVADLWTACSLLHFAGVDAPGTAALFTSSSAHDPYRATDTARLVILVLKTGEPEENT